MITLSATSFDPAGFIVIADHEIDGSSEIDSGSRRVTRTATLDGGVGVVDTGFAHADRTIRLTLSAPSAAHYDAIARLAQLYPTLIITTHEGAWLCVIEDYRAVSGRLEITILITGDA